MPSPSHQVFLLTNRQVEWLAEIAASIVRNNLTHEVTGKWQEIPSWWDSPAGTEARREVDPELLEDAEMAVSCLFALEDSNRDQAAGDTAPIDRRSRQKDVAR